MDDESSTQGGQELSPIELFTPEETAALLKMRELGYNDPVKTLHTWVWTGVIECTKVGRKVAFTREHIRAYLSRKNSPERRAQTKPARRPRTRKPPEKPPC